MIDKYSDMFSPAGAEVSIIPVMSGEIPSQTEDIAMPDTLPLLALRNAVIFPGSIFPITIGRDKSIKLIEDAHKSNSLIGAVPQNDVSVEDPALDDLFPFGTVARIIKTFEMPDGTISAVLQGLKRFEIEDVVSSEPYLRAHVRYLEEFEANPEDPEIKVIADSLKEKASAIIKSSSFAPKEAANAVKSIEDFNFLVNFIATTIDVENFFDKVELLKYEDLKVRAMKLLNVLDTQVELLKIKQEINSKVKNEIDQQQREYYLNNQLRTIQEELGMDDDEEIEKLRAEASKKDWPDSAKEIFEKEIAKLEKYNPSSPDYSIQYNYIKFMLELPWNHLSKDNLDLKHAQKVLDDDHYGLEKVLSNVKMRGTFGEVQLGALLEQMMSPEQYDANVKTKKSGTEFVEFAIKLPGKDDANSTVYLPIDAKFPKDVYEQYYDAFEAGDAALMESSGKQLENTIKKMAKDIHDKYVDPPFTTDFAIMFLPFESIYAEVIRRTSLIETLQKEYKIVVTGPTTLGAILNSLQMGFRTLAIQKRTGEVWTVLGAVKTEFSKFGGLLEKVQKNLQSAGDQLEEVMGKRTRAIERKLRQVEQLPHEESQKILPIDVEDDLTDY